MVKCVLYFYLFSFYLSINEIFLYILLEISFDFLLIFGFIFWKENNKLSLFFVIKGSDYRKLNLKVNNSNLLL